MTLTEFEKRANYQKGYDREFGVWKIIDIHQIPKVFKSTDEVDFYCSNGKRVYLLRLRLAEEKSYIIVEGNKKMGIPPYLIAELPIQNIDNEFLEEVLSNFKIESKRVF